MTIRNGSSTSDTETSPQQPSPQPLTGGQYPASIALTKASIGTGAAGALAMAYSLATGCSLAAGITGIVLVAASVVLEGVNLASGLRRLRTAPQLAGAQQPQDLAIAGLGKRRLRPGEEWNLTIVPGTRVVFCDPKTKAEQAVSRVITNPNAVVTLRDRDETRFAAMPEFFVEET